MSEITYDDIEREFSKDDLSKYNSLCRKFVELADEKNNIELWNMVQQHHSELRDVLDEIHALRESYEFLKGELFFNVWRVTPNPEDTIWHSKLFFKVERHKFKTAGQTLWYEEMRW